MAGPVQVCKRCGVAAGPRRWLTPRYGPACGNVFPSAVRLALTATFRGAFVRPVAARPDDRAVTAGTPISAAERLATASLVLGVLSLVSDGMGIVLGLVAVPLGLLNIYDLRQMGAPDRGTVRLLIGIICGLVGMLCALALPA